MDRARIFHVNVNCTDLERSRRFYSDVLGLHPAVRTAPEVVQPGTAFGLDRARWDAWVLLGASGFDGGAVDLLEWREPRPTGAAPRARTTTGFQRLGVAVPDQREARAGDTIEDPDGVAIQLIEGDAARVAFIAVVCADIERSRAFYASLGFREVGGHDDAGSSEVVCVPAGGGEVSLRLVGFRTGEIERAPARPANAIGMWRLALLVDDLDDALRAPAAAGATMLSEPVEMAMGPGLPVLRFVCFRGPDHEVLELIEQPS
jgi:catechol 2,3-dioxygenase-like lactoylglutathione lyase family enzyme